ncbi:hypothetical protein JCM16358_13460 [Halanaerocella petrolearia]
MRKLSPVVLVGLLVALVGAGFLINQPAKAEKKPQIGYVDMQKLFNNHPQKVASEGKLQGEAKKLQQELEQEAKDLSKEERQKLLQNYQKQLDKLERDLVGQVMQDINEKISQVAQEKGITIVVDKSAVLTGGYNLTDEVLAEVKAETEDQTDNTENNTKTTE